MHAHQLFHVVIAQGRRRPRAFVTGAQLGGDLVGLGPGDHAARPQLQHAGLRLAPEGLAGQAVAEGNTEADAVVVRAHGVARLQVRRQHGQAHAADQAGQPILAEIGLDLCLGLKWAHVTLGADHDSKSRGAP